jgi:hypothetical protein
LTFGQTRGIDIDSKGVVWTPLQNEGVLASFDRSKCKTIPTGKDAITGKVCREGWSFTHVPGPTFKSDPSVLSDNTYYMFIDKYNAIGLGSNTRLSAGYENVGKAAGSVSHGILLALLRWTRRRPETWLERPRSVVREYDARELAYRRRKGHAEPALSFPDSA